MTQEQEQQLTELITGLLEAGVNAEEILSTVRFVINEREEN